MTERAPGRRRVGPRPPRWLNVQRSVLAAAFTAQLAAAGRLAEARHVCFLIEGFSDDSWLEDIKSYHEAEGDLDARCGEWSGATLMHRAAAMQRIDTAAWLQSKGADLDVRDERGNTPLHEAAEAEIEGYMSGRDRRVKLEATRKLIAMGADQGARNDEGKIPYDIKDDHAFTALAERGAPGRASEDPRRRSLMAGIKSTTCVLAVLDLEASRRYYRDKLGFTEDLAVDGWSFLHRGAFRLRLGHCPHATPISQCQDHSWFAYLHVEDAAALYEEFVARGVEVWHALERKPWGVKEFAIVTPDGHRLVFGESVA